ncbi:E motif [Dillenia turbinata]|uniref:E motif n=1 Tax=Dillenia turbinata TaxID=194707 RepID=A0AAN8WB15_9MAGN
MGTTALSHNYLCGYNPPQNVSSKKFELPNLNQNPDLKIRQKLCKPASFLRNQSKATKSSIQQQQHVSLKEAFHCFLESGSVENALYLFEYMNKSDSFIWNVMIRGLTDCGFFREAIDYYHRMQIEGVRTDNFTFPFVIKSCAGSFSLDEGEKVHAKLFKLGLDCDVYICNSLIAMYAKVGFIEYAEKVFEEISIRDLVSWNSMISGYVSVGLGRRSLLCFREMQEFGIKFDRNLQRDFVVSSDAITLINLLPSCGELGVVLEGKSIHGYAIRKGFFPNLVLETALIDMYGDCGKLKSSELVFHQITEASLVSWNAMIAVYVQNGWNREALELFRGLSKDSMEPDSVTIASIIPAFADSALLMEGKQIHAYITKLELGSNNFIANSLIYMYAKFGDLQTSRDLFDRMLHKDVVSWNTIIMAYAIHGCGKISTNLFSKMIEEGMEPNASSFVSLLSSCSNAGMIDEGWQYFNSMKQDYGINPGIEHSGCMIDLLGRAGNLGQAKHFIQEMPLIPTARIWGSLLVAARNNNDIELAEFTAEKIFSLAHDNTGCYVLLSNMYAEAGRWEDVERIKSLMEREGLVKTTGSSVIELNCRSYRFTNDDKSCTKTSIIYDMLDIILGECVHNITKFRPLDLARERRISSWSHSVRLAICFGIISTTTRQPILVRKNTRICKECHDAAKKISKITRREVVVGNVKVFHHFRDGQCSCRDYW